MATHWRHARARAERRGARAAHNAPRRGERGHGEGGVEAALGCARARCAGGWEGPPCERGRGRGRGEVAGRRMDACAGGAASRGL